MQKRSLRNSQRLCLSAAMWLPWSSPTAAHCRCPLPTTPLPLTLTPPSLPSNNTHCVSDSTQVRLFLPAPNSSSSYHFPLYLVTPRQTVACLFCGSSQKMPLFAQGVDPEMHTEINNDHLQWEWQHGWSLGTHVLLSLIMKLWGPNLFNGSESQ